MNIIVARRRSKFRKQSYLAALIHSGSELTDLSSSNLHFWVAE